MKSHLDENWYAKTTHTIQIGLMIGWRDAAIALMRGFKIFNTIVDWIIELGYYGGAICPVGYFKEQKVRRGGCG